MRRSLLLAPVIALAALLVAAVPATANGGPSGTTIRLIAQEESGQFIDVPPAATSPEDASLGDGFVFTARLSTRAGRRAGRLHVVCTLTFVRGNNSVAQCVGTFQLRRGQITVQALGSENQGAFSAAVTGGTDRYTGARGTVRIRDISGNRQAITIRLLP